MKLFIAKHYADKIVGWLSPHCERIAIAGSIRRGRPECADVDLVVIPKHNPDVDLLGQSVGQSNLVFDFLVDYVKERNPTASPARTPRFISGGEKAGKQMLIELPKCQLDLWFADAATWGTRLLCSTGSKEHNIWLAQRAIDRGLRWNPYEGLQPEDGGQRTEAEIYAALGLEFIAPVHRELAWLTQHIDSGL